MFRRHPDPEMIRKPKWRNTAVPERMLVRVKAGAGPTKERTLVKAKVGAAPRPVARANPARMISKSEFTARGLAGQPSALCSG